MLGRNWRLGAVLIGTVAAFGSVAGPAAAAPAPDCEGNLFTDPRGDARDRRAVVANPNHLLDPVGLPVGDNADIVNGFLTTDSDGTVRINLQIVNMGKTVPQGATALSWYFGYRIAGVGTPQFVSATTDGKNYSFGYGHYDRLYRTDGTATGDVIEGPDGFVSIALPDAFEGDTIEQTYASAFIATGVGVPGVASASSLNPADSAPDAGGEGGANVGSYVAGACI
jgi:hypothetical protein